MSVVGVVDVVGVVGVVGVVDVVDVVGVSGANPPPPSSIGKGILLVTICRTTTRDVASEVLSEREKFLKDHAPPHRHRPHQLSTSNVSPPWSHTVRPTDCVLSECIETTSNGWKDSVRRRASEHFVWMPCSVFSQLPPTGHQSYHRSPLPLRHTELLLCR